ncbi:hypothetical protein HK413_01205 [Mucilaginibacter sp. S1162]|uniref:DUF2268 domain-containing protein n=1 Tax=Mucilaginibacter humi TaxID=2732510 RepID=A0ABX1W1M5_9SPHI|nr:hypothetical protein [Mucilaginibacter humi]NNU33139.1 hypothetical protein [Mucilaginibacter humi]
MILSGCGAGCRQVCTDGRELSKVLASIRSHTLQAKQWEPLINPIFEKFRALYPAFQPFKVCFAIGILNTGGTVSNSFVLIGTELAGSTAAADLSEFRPGAFRDNLAFTGDLTQKMISLIAHECVHTQQAPSGPEAAKCPLLSQSLREGSADFVAEQITGRAYTGNHNYGDAHETELWQQFKNELCRSNTAGWLYNYSTIKNRPADLGYYGLPYRPELL